MAREGWLPAWAKEPSKAQQAALGKEGIPKSMPWSQLAGVHLLSLPASSGVCTQFEDRLWNLTQRQLQLGKPCLPSPVTLPSSTTRFLQGAGSPLPVHPARWEAPEIPALAGTSRHSLGACCLVFLFNPGHDPKCST